MSSQIKPMPPSTFSALTPPKDDYVYFENAGDHPFQPLATAYSPVNAWWLAEASFLAYEKGSDLLKKTDLTGRLKLDLRVFEGATLGNQCVVAAGDGFAIVAFRGTQVASFPDPIDLLRLRRIDATDFRIDTDFAIPPQGHIHPGFAASLDEVWDGPNGIKPHLDKIGGKDGRRAIWFTGHSLGAALATLAAERYGRDGVQALYTYGSPRVGDGTFASGFSVPCFRFVNNLDFVPHLPPRDVIEDYEHVNAELRFIDSDGGISGNTSILKAIESGAVENVQALLGTAKAFAPSAILGHLFGTPVPDVPDVAAKLGVDVITFVPLANHAPINYSTRIWNALVQKHP